MGSPSSNRSLPFFVNHIACFLLFFCITFISSFYYGTTVEYDYNQKIDRGFISRDALFFSIREMSSEEHNLDMSDTSSISNSDMTQPSATNISSEETEFAINELLKSCSGGNVFLSSQISNSRAIYYTGNTELPPLVSGRFFSSEDSLATVKIAVIGKNLQNDTWVDESTKKTFITAFDQPYEVIGVIGMESVSTIDDLVYVPFGSVSGEAQISGRFCLDGDADSIREIFTSYSDLLNGNGTYQASEIIMPATATDVVAGGIFLADILQVIIYLFLAATYGCVLMFFLLSILQKTSVMLLQGFSNFYIVKRIISPILCSGCMGILASMLVYFFFWRGGVFALPSTYFFSCMVRNGIIGLFLLLLWIFPLNIVVRKFKLADSLR